SRHGARLRLAGAGGAAAAAGSTGRPARRTARRHAAPRHTAPRHAVPRHTVPTGQEGHLMRTEETLLAALADREQLAPDPEPVLAGARRLAARHRRRRAVGATAAGALLLVTASSVPVLVDRA